MRLNFYLLDAYCNNHQIVPAALRVLTVLGVEEEFVEPKVKKRAKKK